MKDNGNPIISIITPAYKCKSTILETYESIKAQTFSSWEWIVVEDCSGDDTYEYIESLTQNDSRVVLLQTPKNSGAAIARNIGIEYAQGRYIAFLDADDLFVPTKLEKQIRFMSDNGYAFTFTNYNLLYASGTLKTCVVKKEFVNYKMLLKSNYIGCLTVIYDTKILGKVFMPLDCEKREDHGAWLDITRNHINAYRLGESLSIYRIGKKSVSSSKIKMIKYQYRLYRKHEKFNVFKSCWFVLLCTLFKVLFKY